MRELLASIHDTANKIWASLAQNDQVIFYLSLYQFIDIKIYIEGETLDLYLFSPNIDI